MSLDHAGTRLLLALALGLAAIAGLDVVLRAFAFSDGLVRLAEQLAFLGAVLLAMAAARSARRARQSTRPPPWEIPE